MLDKILRFIRERLVALNDLINNITIKMTALEADNNTLRTKVDSNTQSINQIKDDTAWVKLTKSTNWDGADDVCAYRQVGQFVEIRFRVTPKSTFSAGSDPLLIANGLPEAAQPTTWTARSVAYHNGNAYRFEVGVPGTEDAGKLKLYRNVRDVTKGYLVVGHIMYIAKKVGG